MNKERDHLWLILAAAGPAVHFAGCGYGAAILAVLATLPLSLLPRRKWSETGKAMAFVQWLWICVILAALMPHSANYWKGGGIAVPVALLVLGALGQGKGREARSGNVLFWLAVPLVVLVLVMGTKKVEPEWLTPMPGEWTPELLITLLIPCLCEGDRKAALGIGLCTVTGAVLIQGCIGIPVAQMEAAPLYELGRTLGAGGELAVSVLMTIVWFSAGSWLLSRGTWFADQWGIKGRWSAWVTALIPIGLIGMGADITGWWLVGGCILMWVILPMLPLKNN